MTREEMTKVLQAAAGKYPQKVDVERMAPHYFESLKMFEYKDVVDAFKAACRESSTFFPSAAKVESHAKRIGSAGLAHTLEEMEAEQRMRKAREMGDYALAAELEASLKQMRGAWKPQDVEEQREAYKRTPVGESYRREFDNVKYMVNNQRFTSQQVAAEAFLQIQKLLAMMPGRAVSAEHVVKNMTLR